MDIVDYDTLEGKLEISSRPKNLTWTKPWDFIKILTLVLKVKFPIRKGSNFVLSGSEAPDPIDIANMWARSDHNQNPLGWFKFIKGSYRKFYTRAAGEVSWFIGDSDNPPDGFQSLVEGVGLPAGVLAHLKLRYLEISPGRYSYYAARYIGYTERSS